MPKKTKMESTCYFRIETDDYEKLKAIAKSQNRTLSELARMLIGDYVAWWETGGEEVMLGGKKAEEQASVIL